MTSHTPTPCLFAQGSFPCHSFRVFSELKQAQVHTLADGKAAAETRVTTYSRSFRRRGCLARLLAPLDLFLFLNYHHCFCSSWEHLEFVFLCLLHILWRELESVFVCVEPLRRDKLARTGWLSKRSQTPSQCFWVSDFRPTLSLSHSVYLWACDCFVRPLLSAASHYSHAGSGQMASSCMTNVIRRIMHYTAWTYQSWRPAESVHPAKCHPPLSTPPTHACAANWTCTHNLDIHSGVDLVTLEVTWTLGQMLFFQCQEGGFCCDGSRVLFDSRDAQIKRPGTDFQCPSAQTWFVTCAAWA